MTPSRAQLCSGSLGDPVVNFTFGNTSKPLGPRQTSYNYNPVCPEDGEYAIASTVPQCHAADNSWHPLREDHTPNDENGMMMIVNASYAPGDFYVDTVRGLCSNTTYEFASWIMNLLAPGSFCFATGTVPNITFSIENIDGTIIRQYTTGDIKATSTRTWQQFGFFFENSDNSDIVLRLKNNGPGGCGNDLALDDITFRPCGPNVATFVQGGSDSTNVNICQGSSASLIFASEVSAGYTDPAYQWQQSKDEGTTWQDLAGATTLTLPVSIAANAPVGSVQYRLTVAKSSNINIVQCRIASNPITVHINEMPAAEIGSNAPFCAGDDIILTAHKGALFNWRGPNNFTATDSVVVLPDASAANNGWYEVEITSAAGCSLIARLRVTVVAKPVANTAASFSICEGSSVQLQGSGGVAYLWQPATGLTGTTIANPIASPKDSTNYSLIVRNEQGCADTAFTQVNVWKKPTANAGPDRQIMEGDTTLLQGTAEGTNIRIGWTPPVSLTTPQLLQPIAAPVQNTTYTLQVQSLQGCGTATDAVFVRVFRKVDIPNAFSPNGDGVHDKWILQQIETYPEADISVFNRYGQLLYTAKGNGQPWDGTFNGRPLPVASYYYVIDLKNNFPKLSGWIMLLR